MAKVTRRPPRPKPPEHKAPDSTSDAEDGGENEDKKRKRKQRIRQPEFSFPPPEDPLLERCSSPPLRTSHSYVSDVGDPDQRGITPPKMEVGMWALSRTRSAVNPYIEQDLKAAESAPLKSWTNAIFDLPPGRFDEWIREIRENEWFSDDIVQRSLFQYCAAANELQRYKPFVVLVNRIMELARGDLSGIDEEYPLDDFIFADNHNRLVDTIDEHDGLGAHRRPDIVGLLRKHAKKLDKTSGTLKWVNILLFLELKYRGNLLEMLNTERMKRGLPALASSGSAIRTEAEGDDSDSENESEESEEHPPKPATKRRKLPPRRVEVTAPEPQPVRRGRGRATPAETDDSLEEEDLLAGLARDPRLKALKVQNDQTQNLDAGRDVAIQAASYALEVLSCTYGTRSFCLSGIVKDDVLSLWYYDASGIVYTKERVSLVQTFEKFAAIIVGFAQCTPEQFGAIPTSVLRPPAPYPRGFPPEDLCENSLWITHPITKEHVGITLNKSLFTQYGMIGRRTFLYTIDTDRVISDKELTIKFSYQVSTRQPEHSLVQIAKKAKVRHLPDVHMWADLWKMSDGVRRAFLRKDESQVPFEDRTLRAIVYTKYSPIKPLFEKLPELIPVMVYQMMNCLDDLWTKLNMLHRDISVNNIMYEKHGDYYHFILIDFDMAVIVPKGESSYVASSRHRTGTLPFMAQELVNDARTATLQERTWIPMRHLLRHDFESLFWVALWCVLTLLNKGLSASQVDKLLGFARSWEIGDLEPISAIKFKTMYDGLTKYRIVLPPRATCLKAWFKAWTSLLKEGNHVASQYSPDDSDSDSDDEGASAKAWETGGGNLTKDRLHSALLQAFPIPAQYLKSPEIEIPKRRARMTKATAPKEAPKPQRPARKRAKASPPEVAPENDIRSRLRPRKPRV